MRRFVNCSAERKEDFGTLLKYTRKSEIGNFQIAISRARNNIFGRTKKRLDPCIQGFHISISHFLTCRPPPVALKCYICKNLVNCKVVRIGLRAISTVHVRTENHLHNQTGNCLGRIKHYNLGN